MSETAIPSLYDWAGGSVVLEKLTDIFYRKVKSDALIGPVFAHMDDRHPKFVAQFIGEVLGGPTEYSEQRGGHPHMIRQHLERHLAEPMRRRWVELLVDAADEAGLPDDPEFRSALLGYIEWGSRLAVINSQPGADISGIDQPMPKWGWGEVKGPYQGT